jgi:hypothetical protein
MTVVLILLALFAMLFALPTPCSDRLGDADS